jgi:hypothetical protein
MDHLDVKQPGLTGFVTIPVLHHALGIHTLDEELNGLPEPVVYDSIKAHVRHLDVRRRRSAAPRQRT